MATKSHWESVYEPESADAVSRYAPHLSTSLQYIRRAAPALTAAIIDMGGGESTLVDDLLAAGCGKLTVLDISATARDATRRRIGPAGEGVNWLAADVLRADLPAAGFDILHDRAVFHFLTGDEQLQRYVEQVLHALKPGAFAIVGNLWSARVGEVQRTAGVELFGRRVASHLRRNVPAPRQPHRGAHHALG